MIACSIPVPEQFASLARLQPGWLDGEGTAYQSDQLRAVENVLTCLISDYQLPCPYIYPTPEGEVRAEWPGPVWEVVACFDPAKEQIRLLATCTKEITGEAITHSTADTIRLGNLLQKLLSQRGPTSIGERPVTAPR